MISALAVLLIVAVAMPASALENKFGGYWRTRAWTQQNFTGEDKTKAENLTNVDTRTRLFYTAIINENLKFENKFEFNSVWGDTNGGDIGADGEKNWRIKHSYADFTLAPVNFKVGIQAVTIGRGLLFDDDFSGAIITYKAEGFELPFMWMKAYEGGKGKDANDGDFDFYGLMPSFTISETFTITPYIIWGTSENAGKWKPILHTTASPDSFEGFEKVNIYYLGVDMDAKFDMGKAWFTAIYQGGKGDLLKANPYSSIDFSAWLAAVGVSVNLSDQADIHGQFFYASGDKDNDDQLEAFFFPSQDYGTGQSYYWAEIMGLGIFDDYATSNTPGDKISNIMAANIGTTFSPAKDFSITLDIWYAKLVEEDANKEDYLGTEVDLVLSYELVQGLKLDLVGAYLFRGDATYKGADDANPYELGAQLSLSF